MEKLVIAVLVPVVIYAVYYLLKKTEENLKAVKRILSPEAKEILTDEVAYYQRLSDTDKAVFETRALTFLDQVHIEGVGTEITLKDSILIAASAIIPVFGFPDWTYKNLTNIIVYPDTFNQDFEFQGQETRQILGMVGEGYMNGQMILSKRALIYGFSNKSDKENTAIHEFVHLLDKTDGATDGIPELLMDHSYALPWIELMRQETARIMANKSDINPYALTNQAEFFAVVSEYFFEQPHLLKEKHPKLYEALSQIFEQKL